MCKNKNAVQLCRDYTNNQCLCSRYTKSDSTNFLLVKSETSKVIKLFSCLTQLKSILLITHMNRINYRLWSSKPEILVYLGYFSIYEQFKFYAQPS